MFIRPTLDIVQWLMVLMVLVLFVVDGGGVGGGNGFGGGNGVGGGGVLVVV